MTMHHANASPSRPPSLPLSLALLAPLATLGCKRSAPEATNAQVHTADERADAHADPNANPSTAAHAINAVNAPGACDEELHRAGSGDSIQDLTQNSRALFWREAQSIMTWPKPDGPARVALPLRARELAADEQYLYVALQNPSQNGLYRIPIQGGEPELMARPGGVFNMVDDLLVNDTHVIMSRNMGEVTRVAKAPPFALQAYARRDQRRNTFAGWAASTHAVWFARPGAGLGTSNWARLDLESGAVTALAPPVARVHAEGPTVVIVRGERAGVLTTNPSQQRHQLFVASEATGQSPAAPWWEGPWVFGVGMSGDDIVFRTVVDAPANAMPTLGWLHGPIGAAPPQRLRSCPQGRSLTTTPLATAIDGATLYTVMSDNSNRHALVRVRAQQ